MENLRMIVTSVIVLAIVSSAFSFKVKGSDFCVLAYSVSGTNCTTYLLNKLVGSTGTHYKFVPYWDMNRVACPANGNGLCTAGPIQFDGPDFGIK